MEVYSPLREGTCSRVRLRVDCRVRTEASATRARAFCVGAPLVGWNG